VTAGRVARVAAALGAGMLAAASLRTTYAERAYVAGLDLTVDPRRSPALDLPGRLEAYEDAMSRDPGEELYVLRAGQIRLLRAARRDGAVDRRELAAARALLVRATELRPLDSRPRAQLALAARMAGDSEEALRAAKEAAALAPNAPGPMRVAADVGLWAWTQTGDPAALRSALAAGMALAGIGEESPDRAIVNALGRAGPDLAQDLVEATKEDPTLAAYAAAAARPLKPEVARLLDPPDERTRRGP
jgi:tetratricopeptide (TPR) repeat protein